MYEFTATGLFHRLFRLCLWAAHLPLLLGVLWVMGLVFCQPLCAIAVVPFAIIFIRCLNRNGRAYLRLWTAGFCLFELVLFSVLPGTPAEKHLKDLPRTPRITQSNDDMVHITNLRDYIHNANSSSEERYLEEDFDLTQLTGVYLSECFRGKNSTDCQLMLSFAFRDGRYLVIAPEIRLPIGTTANPVRVYYKNYELSYTFGTEEDVFALSTDYLHNYLTLYPLKADAAQMKQMFLRCLELAQLTQDRGRAFHPLQQAYANDLLSVLHLICPELPEYRPISNTNVAKLLYRNGATLIQEQGDWSAVRRKYALGFNVRPEVREEYSDVIRTRLGLPVRAALPQRHVQQCLEEKLPVTKTKAEEPKAPATAADIPEPRARLANDDRPLPAAEPTIEKTAEEKTEVKPAESTEKTEDPPAADENGVINKDDAAAVAAATRELDKKEQLLSSKDAVRARSAADGILEPGARLYADDRREEEEEAARAERKRRAAEGRDIMDEDEENMGDESKFNELFFGKRKSGITIIEKEKTKEEAHPLDPIRKRKRVNPFDDEKPKQRPKEYDPFAPKTPIRI